MRVNGFRGGRIVSIGGRRISAIKITCKTVRQNRRDHSFKKIYSKIQNILAASSFLTGSCTVGWPFGVEVCETVVGPERLALGFFTAILLFRCSACNKLEATR